VFRRCLFEAGFRPLKDFSDLNPANSVLIVLGDPTPLARVPGGLKEFVKNGGGLLVATDWATDSAAGDQLEDATGLRVDGRSLIQDNLNRCYGQRNYRPFLFTSLRGQPSWLLQNADVDKDGMSRVATDAPSFLR